MRLGIMQPYFFPYIGHFSLIAATDAWIVFDVSQYTPKSWMNRNRVLHPVQGWNWLTVPLENSSISIKTVEANILDVQASKKSVLGKLSHLKKTAPFYRAVERIVLQTFDLPDGDKSLVHLNVRGLQAVCDYLELPFRYRICSDLELNLPESLPPGEWALEICDKLGADAYLNPMGGRPIFDPTLYAQRGITLQFLEAHPFSYSTDPYEFIPGMSILDVLIWNDPATVRATIQNDVTLHLGEDRLDA